MHIGIIDYCAGNALSVLRAFNKLDIPAFISGDVAALAIADKLVLPGVGAFDEAMKQLEANGIKDLLTRVVKNGATPFLGICLGMQLVAAHSEEGTKSGLGWLDAATVRFSGQDNIKVPHTGWGYVQQQKQSRLFAGMHGRPRFYFNHSYHVVCNDPADILCTTHYGSTFVSAVEKQNIAGVQFHPEKSGSYGAMLLKNFAENF